MSRYRHLPEIALLWIFMAGCGERIQFQELPLGLGADTALESQDGARERVAAALKPITLLFFGYTRCPDFCPMTLHKLHAAVGEDAQLKDNLRLIFISVDPQNDKPAELKRYLSAFSYARGYTGSAEELRQTEKSFGAFSKPADKTISHSLYLYVLNRQGRVIHLIRSDAPVAELRNVMQQALQHNQGK